MITRVHLLNKTAFYFAKNLQFQKCDRNVVICYFILVAYDPLSPLPPQTFVLSTPTTSLLPPSLYRLLDHFETFSVEPYFFLSFYLEKRGDFFFDNFWWEINGDFESSFRTIAKKNVMNRSPRVWYRNKHRTYKNKRTYDMHGTPSWDGYMKDKNCMSTHRPPLSSRRSRLSPPPPSLHLLVGCYSLRV